MSAVVIETIAKACGGEADDSGGVYFTRKAWGFFLADIKSKDGGSELVKAAPVAEIEDWEKDDAFYRLRDKFAMHALAGMNANQWWQGGPEVRAREAYEQADAMMKARKQGMSQ